MIDGSISYDLVQKIADERGLDPTALRPLHEVVDPDALEAMFDESDGSKLRDGHVVFGYEGFTVRVDHDRTITITPADE